MEELYFDAEFGIAAQTALPMETSDRIYKEAKDLLINLMEIEVPVIAATRGKNFVHAELATMSDIVLADSTAVFADKAHFVFGAVPGEKPSNLRGWLIDAMRCAPANRWPAGCGS